MGTIHLDREGDVFVLRYDNGENRFRPETLSEWHAALDELRQQLATALGT